MRPLAASRAAPSPRAAAQASPLLEAAFREEERRGIVLAALVQTAAVSAVALYFALTRPMDSAIFLFVPVALLGLAAISFAQFALARANVNPPWMKYFVVSLQCLYLGALFIVRNPFLAWHAPAAEAVREGGVLFFFGFLVQAAFSYSPAYVLWTGASIVLAWSAVVVDALTAPGTAAGFLAPGEAGAALVAAAGPDYLPLQLVVVELLVVLLFAAGLAVAVARSRRLVISAAGSERARANLARYFSPRMIETLSARDEPFGHVRRQMAAVLFADIRGFTAYAEATPPEDVLELLRGFHARMETEVFEAGGTLDKIVGDGFMAVFGLPDQGERDASRALFCARSMLSVLERWNRERAREGAWEIRIGIGLHYGPVVAGDIGSERSSSFAVIGDTVNAASRLQGLSKELGVRLVASAALAEQVQSESGAAARSLLEGLSGPLRASLRGRERDIEVRTLP